MMRSWSGRRAARTPLGRRAWTSALTAWVVAGLAACSGSDSIQPTPAVTVSGAAIPVGVVGEAYSHSLTATGGDGSFTWSLVSGSLPPGLALSSSGALTGTPTAAGTSDFSVRVASADQNTMTEVQLIVVDPVAITTSALPAGRTGTAYGESLVATGGTGTYAWSVASGGLPPGLTLDAAGLLSGTPAAADTRDVTVQVESGDQTVARVLSLSVFDPLDVATAALDEGVVGVEYSASLAAGGGAGPYHWTLTAGTLPAGLALDTTGVLSGTPSSVETASFTVGVESEDETATRSFQLAVVEPLVITTASLPEAVSNATYEHSFVANGGTGEYVWTTTAGELPEGLTLSDDGVLSGTPTGPGSSDFTVQAISGGQTVDAAFGLTVVEPLVLFTARLPDGQVHVPYSESVVATGGSGGYTFALESGELPAGTSLIEATGEISGTPTEARNFAFMIQVTSGSQTTNGQFTVTIEPEACTLASLPDTDGDRLPDCAETNSGVYVSSTATGTNPTLADTDGDGIDDGDEVLGTRDGLDLPAMGTNPLQQNILIEYDWFQDSEASAPHDHRPSASTIAKVAAAFAAAPVNNPDGTTGIVAIQDYGQGGPFTGGTVLGDPDGCIVGGVGGAEYNSYISANFAANRLGYFHYSLMIHRYNATATGSCAGASGSSGQAVYNDHRLVVSSNTWHNGGSGDQWVANTILHEIGHNLNLTHGGARDAQSGLNYKPNYNSVMNYRYQFSGVDTGCDVTADGFLDYSRGTRIALDESAVDESKGVCGDVAIDWNNDGDATDTGFAFDLQEYDNGSGSGGANGSTTDVLEDYDDWANITLASSVSGAPLPGGASLFKEVESCTSAPPTPDRR